MKMTRESPIISVRVTHEELEMLEGLITLERARAEQAGFLANVTASGLLRLLLREKAKAAGIKTGPGKPLEPESEPLFPEILLATKSETPAPVEKPSVMMHGIRYRPAGHTAPILVDQVIEAPIVEAPVPVSAAPIVEKAPTPQLVDEKPSPTEGLAYDVRNRVALALARGVFTQNALARLAGVDAGGMSKFVKGASLGRPKLEALDRVLKEKSV